MVGTVTVAAPRPMDQVERKAISLRGSGLPDDVLRRACRQVLDDGLPLRDAIVLREARRLAEMRTERADTAWAAVCGALRDYVPESTLRLWIEPIEVAGEEGATLVLTAPDNVRAWVERRYTALIGEALRECSDFTAVQFVPSGETR